MLPQNGRLLNALAEAQIFVGSSGSQLFAEYRTSKSIRDMLSAEPNDPRINEAILFLTVWGGRLIGVAKQDLGVEAK
jgi:hypothetical protein